MTLDTCQYYGDAVCGLTSRRYCIGSDEDATTYACRCMDGYDVVDGECQDADECKGGPCKEKETCINTPGSYKCVCQSGYMRNHDGLCANVNECASPSLHDCEHVCEDAEPPLRFSCTCYPGYTWQAFTRSCVIDDELTKCDCEDDDKSVCYQPRDGEKQCHPRPGYALVNGTFQDEAECDSEERLSSWCGVSSECVDGEGTATCNCLSGYANDTINYGQCEGIIAISLILDLILQIFFKQSLRTSRTTGVAQMSPLSSRQGPADSSNYRPSLHLHPVVCPTGTVLSDSACVEPCHTIQCAPPLRCGVTSEGVPECRCLSECQALLEPEVTSSVYRGVVDGLGYGDASHESARNDLRRGQHGDPERDTGCQQTLRHHAL
ncbi:hypothetical protein C7M84_018916 [Penaeus vannamei]|uniref:EGF-like domain-containing protein n=1 Tax=Penaeus vannamei TaxID=6689 RepID=A0A423SG93_PENVA|nr:hypothetical protein C7M84_018916 [Penaeus vannamei]